MSSSLISHLNSQCFIFHAVSRTLHEYTRDLCAKLTHAWKLAQASTDALQLSDKERADSRRPRVFTFKKGDQVLKHDPDVKRNKLAPKYHGPYRILEVHEHDTYTLRDLHSRRVVARVHVDRLKPYSVTENKPLREDEWLVERLLDIRFNPQRGEEVLVKWVGFPAAESTWEPVRNLLERCADEVAECRATAFSRRRPAATTANLPASDADPAQPPALASAPKRTPEVASSPPDQSPLPTHATSPALHVPCPLGPGEPIKAKFERGDWYYLEEAIHRSGRITERWFPYTRYSDQMLQSPRLQGLRLEFLDANPTLAPVIAAILSARPALRL